MLLARFHTSEVIAHANDGEYHWMRARDQHILNTVTMSSTFAFRIFEHFCAETINKHGTSHSGVWKYVTPSVNSYSKRQFVSLNYVWDSNKAQWTPRFRRLFNWFLLIDCCLVSSDRIKSNFFIDSVDLWAFLWIVLIISVRLKSINWKDNRFKSIFFFVFFFGNDRLECFSNFIF